MRFNPRSVPSHARSASIGLLADVAVSVAATGWTPAQAGESVLYSFQGGTDGANPSASLISDQDGALYGTTSVGGSSNCAGGCGTVFKLTPPAAGQTQWTESVLYSFCAQSNCTDGAYPTGLILDQQGNLYGTTVDGGSGNCACGTMFMLVPPPAGQTQWTETVLYNFQGGTTDGAFPKAGLIFDQQSALYGTTAEGGPSASCTGGCGTVFKLTPPAAGQTQWSESVLYGFQGGTDGMEPVAGLIFDPQGALYGTTAYGGGTSNCGAGPVGPVGCGTVFKLAPPAAGQTQWSESVLHSFAGKPDGAYPVAGLIFNQQGALYGTTEEGGTLDYGMVFKLTPPAAGQTQWARSELHSFAGRDGAYPVAGVIFDAYGALYGTTSSGGRAGYGAVFELTSPADRQALWTESVLYSFCSQSNCSDGFNPWAGRIFVQQDALYGTTFAGGARNSGTVFRLTCNADIFGGRLRCPHW